MSSFCRRLVNGEFLRNFKIKKVSILIKGRMNLEMGFEVSVRLNTVVVKSFVSKSVEESNCQSTAEASIQLLSCCIICIIIAFFWSCTVIALQGAVLKVKHLRALGT
eukprot:TRINITY_DN6811_c0_g2_i1.p1 TRINITY_DN6811_c0_g2~~TRINITY_DN6811_c0_g2_i1.p1  ORF type:complete len:107 (-),score=14.32 TRINITY_DN6811_c0_g2_i1:69-389(-)